MKSAVPFMRGSRGRGRVSVPPENHKNIGFLSNAGPNPLKNHRAFKPTLNVGLSSARQRNAIKMAVRWRADIFAFSGIGSHHQLKKSY